MSTRYQSRSSLLPSYSAYRGTGSLSPTWQNSSHSNVKKVKWLWSVAEAAIKGRISVGAWSLTKAAIKRHISVSAWGLAWVERRISICMQNLADVAIECRISIRAWRLADDSIKWHIFVPSKEESLKCAVNQSMLKIACAWTNCRRNGQNGSYVTHYWLLCTNAQMARLSKRPFLGGKSVLRF